MLDPAGDFDEPDEPPAEPADAHHTETWIVSHPVHAAQVDAGAEESRLRLETNLRKAHGQLRDTEELLAVRDERLRQLEDSLRQAHEASVQQQAQLRTVHEEFAAATTQRRTELEVGQQAASAAAEQRAAELRSELAQAHAELAAAGLHVTQLQQQLAASEAQGRAHEHTVLERRQALVASELAHTNALLDLNAERERNALCLESLHSAESHRQVTHSVVADLQREVDEQQSSLTRLGHELASRDARAHEQDAELVRRAARIMRLEQQSGSPIAAPPPPPVLAPPAAEHSAVTAVSASPAVIADALAPDAEEATSTRTRELEADLRAAEDTINRLESQARGRGARLEELEKANLQWRLAAHEAHGTSTETSATNAALHAVHEANETRGAGAPAPLPEGATRLLVCKDKGHEIVHVLGRKTSIGRTPDNDLQIDAKFISRHHAVILAGPVYTVIEDLNSTNGVLVNGQRITRQMLKEGDDVLIGRAHYRFAVRHAGEKH